MSTKTKAKKVNEHVNEHKVGDKLSVSGMDILLWNESMVDGKMSEHFYNLATKYHREFELKRIKFWQNIGLQYPNVVKDFVMSYEHDDCMIELKEINKENVDLLTPQLLDLQIEQLKLKIERGKKA